MAKRILLHFGAHKTGSSTIQATLSANRGALEKSGILYASHGENVDKLLFVHFTRNFGDKILFPKMPAAHVERMAKRRATETFKLIKNKDLDIVILSNEHFCLLKKPGLNRLKRFLGPLGKIEIIYFYRDLVPWLSSHTQQLAKAGHRDKPVSFSKGMERLYRTPRRLIDYWGKQRVRFVNFDSALNTGITDALLGPDMPSTADLGINEEPAANAGISAEAVRLYFLYNRLVRQGRVKRSKEIEDMIRAVPGEKYRIKGVTEEEQAEYATLYQEMTETIGLNLMPPDQLPIADVPDPIHSVTSEIIEQLKAA